MQMWRMPKCVFCLYLSMYTLPHIFRGHKWPLEVFIFNLDLPQQFSSQYSSLLGIFSLPQKKGNLHIWILSMCYYTLVYKISWQHTKIVSNLFQYILILQTAMYFVQMCTIYNKCVGNIYYLKKKKRMLCVPYNVEQIWYTRLGRGKHVMLLVLAASMP